MKPKMFGISILAATLPFSAKVHAEALGTEVFLSTNPIAPLAAAPWRSGYARMLIPLASNLEYGGSLNTTLRFQGRHAVELRLSGGQTHFAGIAQIQPAYHYFLSAPTAHTGWHGSLYTGAHVRGWAYVNTATDIWTEHIAPGLHIGYWLNYEWFLLDIRVAQPVAIYSTSSGDHARSAFAFRFSPLTRVSPVLPVLGISIGWRI